MIAAFADDDREVGGEIGRTAELRHHALGPHGCFLSACCRSWTWFALLIAALETPRDELQERFCRTNRMSSKNLEVAIVSTRTRRWR